MMINIHSVAGKSI